MAIVAEAEEQKLGTFLTPSDLNQILTPTLRKQSVVKSYFVDPEEERTDRIMEYTTSLANIFLEYYPGKLITEVLIQFQRILPDLLDDYGQNRYFTKNHIANHFLALLDYRLNMVGTKLSPKHIDLVRDLLDIKKGKTFSFFSMKQVQSELLAAGFLQRKRREVFSPLLKNKVSQIINDFSMLFPRFEENFDNLLKKAFYLIEEKIIPRINIDEAALVMVSALIPYFIEERGVMNGFWIIIEDQFNMEIDYLKRKVYRYRSLLKKKERDEGLGLGKYLKEELP